MDASTFLAQLSTAELVRWDGLLEQGMSEAGAQAIIRPGFEPYVTVLVANDPGDRSETVFDHLEAAIEELPRWPNRAGRTPSGVRICRGIGIDAPLCGALVVLSACEGLADLHELAVWMAYRRGCRRFLVVVTESDRQSDDERCARLARDSADKIRGWLGDAQVLHEWGSGALAKQGNDGPAGLPFARRIWNVVEEWHQSPDHWDQRQKEACPSAPILEVLRTLEELQQPACGMSGEPWHEEADSYAEPWHQETDTCVLDLGHCAFHDVPRTEYFELDFTAPGHGLPFTGSWVVQSCEQLWNRGRREYLWQDNTCFHIDRAPSKVSRRGRPYVPGFMLPSQELLRNWERTADISDLDSRFAVWSPRTSQLPEPFYWEVEAILGMSFAPGYSTLGGLMQGPTSDAAIRCRSCNEWMHYVFSGGEWGDYKMHLWICSRCPDEAVVSFQA